MALRVALEKLSASASAMAEASQDINALVSRMDSLPQAEPARTPIHVTPAATVSSAPPTAQPVLPKNVPSILGGTMELPERWAIPAAEPTATRADDAPEPAPVLKPYPRPQRPLQPAKPAMTTEEKIMRAVSIGGAAITIAGIILLVSVAIQRGWLGPLGRVVGAYLIGAILFGAASWLGKRGTRVEAIIALVLTAQIAFIATTAALIYVLEWWPPGLGSLVILLSNIAFLAVAAAWSGLTQKEDWESHAAGRSVFLAVSIVTGLMAWFFATGTDAWWPTLGIIAALLLSYTVADSRIRLGLAALAVFLQFILISSWDQMSLVAACIGIVTPVLLVALTLWDPVKTRAEDTTDIRLAEYWRSFETNPTASWVGVAAPVPIIICLALPLIELDAIWFTLMPAVIIAGMGVFAALSSRTAQNQEASPLYAESTPVEYQRIARLIAVTGMALIAAILVGIRYNNSVMNEPAGLFNGTLPVMIYLLAGAALFLWLRNLPEQYNFGIVPWVAWLLGAVVITGVLFRNVITLTPLWLTDTSALIQAVLILVFIGATVLAREHFSGRELWLQLLVGATMLYLSATAIVTITTYLGNLIVQEIGMHLGFLVGHATVSIIWMVIAAVLMLHRSLLTQPGALWTGVGLAVAGTVKLVFFDLVALSGVPRAIAFLLSGLALLTIAALRGRRTGENRSEDGTNPTTGAEPVAGVEDAETRYV